MFVLKNKETALQIISDALEAFKAVHDGRVTHNGKPVTVNLSVWGCEHGDHCQVCLAGAYHLAKTGRLISHERTPVSDVEYFLNDLRSAYWRVLYELEAGGIKIPPVAIDYNRQDPQHIIEFLEALLKLNSPEEPIPVPAKQKRQQPVSVRA